MTSAKLPTSIGVARLLDDGTLVLDLRGPLGAEARLSFAPDHARYEETLAHVGGLVRGETKPVPPWPDPWDAERVEKAAQAYAARRGWDEGTYRLVLVGTSKDGNAYVTLAPSDRAESVGIEVSPETYTVVAERPLPR